MASDKIYKETKSALLQKLRDFEKIAQRTQTHCIVDLTYSDLLALINELANSKLTKLVNSPAE